MTDILLPDLNVTVDFNPAMLKPIFIGPLAPIATVDFNPAMLKPIIPPPLPEESCAAEGSDVIFDGVITHYINCQVGEWYVSRGQFKNLVFGGAGNDIIHSGDHDDTLIGGAGIDFIRAGAGNDEIIGGSDGDIMFGDAGKDVFKWFTGDISKDTREVDVVYDFTVGQDKIDLSKLDANLNKAGMQRWKFTGNFQHYHTPKLGEVYYCKDQYALIGNIDNDSNSELIIQLIGVLNPCNPPKITITSADLIL
jgi:hypothetical protein